MGDLNKLVVHIGQLKSGRWVAATGRSPYFCVEAESEDAVKQLASRALEFYDRASQTRASAEFSFTSKITARELVAA